MNTCTFADLSWETQLCSAVNYCRRVGMTIFSCFLSVAFTCSVLPLSLVCVCVCVCQSHVL